jgi:hypothetical protein
MNKTPQAQPNVQTRGHKHEEETISTNKWSWTNSINQFNRKNDEKINNWQKKSNMS